MKRVTSVELILQLSENHVSKQTALYTALREAIIAQAIAPNQRLPSTREFARANGISRGTAVIVYELLQAEGYVVTRRGAGTFVPPSLPDDRMVAPKAGSQLDLQLQPAAERSRAPAEALSRLGHRLASTTLPVEDTVRRPVPFVPYLPALDEFPISLWARLTAKHARLVKPDLLGHGHAAGWPRLRIALGAYLRTTRGIDCRHEQIILTSCTRQSLLLCARLLAEPGDAALIEDPGHPGALAALDVAGLEVVPIPVDSDGMNIGACRQFRGRPRLAYVTPAAQYPTGAVMSVDRRHELLDWAARHGAWLFEDDDESEFRYCGHPMPALYGMGTSGCVLYAGSFDKTLFPALRMSYLVVPPQLVDVFARAQAVYARWPAILPQLVLCDFIESGHFVRHVRRMAECYRERRAALMDAMNERLGGAVAITPSPCGLALAVLWQDGRDAETIAAAAEARNLRVGPISSFRIRNRVPSGSVLGFAAYDASALRNAVDRLAGVVEGLPDGSGPAPLWLPVAGTDVRSGRDVARRLAGAMSGGR
jgi:GntR family transcriptional regulator / MocR family aminotransferase